MGVGQSRLDLTATALCADRPQLPQLGSLYRSQLARMRPRCNSWELGSERDNQKERVTCLARSKAIEMFVQSWSFSVDPNCLDSLAYLVLK